MRLLRYGRIHGHLIERYSGNHRCPGYLMEHQEGGVDFALHWMDTNHPIFGAWISTTLGSK